MDRKVEPITNREDYIDSRDIEERIEWLQSFRGRVLEGEEAQEGELQALLKVREQGENTADWLDGAQLIRDEAFLEYAKELASDLTDYSRSEQWPYSHIDWEGAAEDLKQDYFDIDFDGVTYWVRG